MKCFPVATTPSARDSPCRPATNAQPISATRCGASPKVSSVRPEAVAVGELEDPVAAELGELLGEGHLPEKVVDALRHAAGRVAVERLGRFEVGCRHGLRDRRRRGGGAAYDELCRQHDLLRL